ncbi:MAG: AarF/UbiB family protein [Desulfosarcinaceae bacterium]|nr:AarF/UbiB family protein [Desulfosarcinaceae bacterium]
MLQHRLQAPSRYTAAASAAHAGHAVHIGKRIRRLRRYFLLLLLKTLWWDVICNVAPLRWLRPSAERRWAALATQFAELATELGGVLIKLGQFLSTRVDILPPEVIQELAGLQDRIDPEPIGEITAFLAAQFGRPVSAVFAAFEEAPLGAASLAQAHRARLPDGAPVVVKVLRPHIDRIVEADLTVLDRLVRRLGWIRAVRERLDLEQLLREFAATTRLELDLLREKGELEQFAIDFGRRTEIHIPRVFADFCLPAVLTLEDVAYIKINDTAAMRACGIDPAQVADRLYDAYMFQIFVTHRVHVDPHPGNLFVRPLPTEAEQAEGCAAFLPGDPVPSAEARDFQLVFIDFGMTALVSERLKAAMRMGAIGVGTQDARKIVQALIMAGTLRPGADLRRLEEAHQEWLQKIWGLRLGSLNETARRELRYFLREYRDLVRHTPFQVQADMLYIGRAVGLLAGLATAIDPEFDPWSRSLAYARRFAKEELTEDWQGLWEELYLLGKSMWQIPGELEQVLSRAKQGALAVQVSLSPQTRRAIRRIDSSVHRFAWMLIAAALLVSGVNLYIAGKVRPFGMIMMGLAGGAFLWGMRRRN